MSEEIKKEHCRHCRKEIAENDRCIVVALLKLKEGDLDNIENQQYYHTWCWLEIAGKDYEI